MATRERKRAYIYFTIAGAVVLSILAGNAYLRSRPKPDPGDGCLQSVSAKTVILLDHSEGVPEQTKREIVSRAITFVREKTGVGDRVSVFTVSDLSTRNLQPIFSYCKPKMEANALVELRRKVESDFKNKFELPLRRALDTEITGARESPIAQAIIDLSLSNYMSGGDHGSLLVFSDMLENTKGFSMYKCKSGVEGIQHFRNSRAGARQRPSFKDLAIYLNVVPRKHINQPAIACRDAFWVWFFGDDSGSDAGLKTEYLPG